MHPVARIAAARPAETIRDRWTRVLLVGFASRRLCTSVTARPSTSDRLEAVRPSGFDIVSLRVRRVDVATVDQGACGLTAVGLR
jgi:hypothetical protein